MQRAKSGTHILSGSWIAILSSDIVEKSVGCDSCSGVVLTSQKIDSMSEVANSRMHRDFIILSLRSTPMNSLVGSLSLGISSGTMRTSWSGSENWKDSNKLTHHAKHPHLQDVIRERLSTLYHKSGEKVTDEIRSRYSDLLAHGVWCSMTWSSPRSTDRLRDIFRSGSSDTSESDTHHWVDLWLQNPRNRRSTHAEYPISRQAHRWTRKRESHGEDIEEVKNSNNLWIVNFTVFLILRL